MWGDCDFFFLLRILPGKTLRTFFHDQCVGHSKELLFSVKGLVRESCVPGKGEPFSPPQVPSNFAPHQNERWNLTLVKFTTQGVMPADGSKYDSPERSLLHISLPVNKTPGWKYMGAKGIARPRWFLRSKQCWQRPSVRCGDRKWGFVATGVNIKHSRTL